MPLAGERGRLNTFHLELEDAIRPLSLRIVGLLIILQFFDIWAFGFPRIDGVLTVFLGLAKAFSLYFAVQTVRSVLTNALVTCLKRRLTLTSFTDKTNTGVMANRNGNSHVWLGCNQKPVRRTFRHSSPCERCCFPSFTGSNHLHAAEAHKAASPSLGLCSCSPHAIPSQHGRHQSCRVYSTATGSSAPRPTPGSTANGQGKSRL